MEVIKRSPALGDNSSYQMIDVGEKPVTRRRAVAQGTVRLSQAAFQAICDRSNPKGDVLALAEAAGIMAAKKTSDLIPLCHPLALSQVRVSFELVHPTKSVVVFCQAIADAKTGVEMEALSGVNGALLTIYDLSKAVDPEITLTEIRLNTKEGGKSGYWTHPTYESENEIKPRQRPQAWQSVRAAVITVSDRVHAKKAEDISGPRAQALLQEQGAQVVLTSVVEDEKTSIEKQIKKSIAESSANFVLLTGGTGLSPRDVTPEVLEKICQRLVPGIGELLRSRGALFTPMSWLSRSQAGYFDDTLIIALPGSPKAVEQGLEALVEILPHALHVSSGGNHD